jgi:carbon monoxide dehydrogenase subunit G
MATESFSRTLATTSDAGTCWGVLTDVSRVAGWVTVVGEVNEIEPLAKYSTVLMDKVGPFKLKADLDIKVPEVEAPHRIRITAAGEDRQVASRIAIDATLEIKDAGSGGAEVDVSGSYSVTGRVASMASSQVKRKADKILEEFFTQAGQELGTAS